MNSEQFSLILLLSLTAGCSPFVLTVVCCEVVLSPKGD